MTTSEKLEDDPAATGHLNVMLDVSEADSLPESNRLKIVNSYVAAVRAKVEFGMCAIVVNRDAMFGMMRIFGVFAERNFRAIRVFRGTAEADAWLNPDYTQMYGPPPNCKRFEVGRSSVRVNVSGLFVENYSPGTR